MMHASANTIRVRPLAFLKNLVVKQGRRPLRVPTGLFKGITLDLDLAHETQKFFGLYETETNNFIREAASRCRWAIEVGAGTGELVLYLLLKSKCNRVFAFEPQQQEIELLRSNLASNGLPENERIMVSSAFVGTNSGPDFVSLDSIEVDIQQKGFIKIDVDGQEMEVLLSGTELLSKGNVDVLVETHSLSLEKECMGFLERHGYSCSVIDNAWWRAIIPEQRPIPHNRWFSAIKAV